MDFNGSVEIKYIRILQISSNNKERDLLMRRENECQYRANAFVVCHRESSDAEAQCPVSSTRPSKP